jgi:hypothetical protein
VNLAQRIILILALLVAFVMVLFPPWVYVYDPPARTRFVRSERPAGYHLLFGSHIPQDQSELNRIFGQSPGFQSGLQFFSIQLDGARLALQLVGLSVLAVIVFLVLSSRPSRKS